VLGKYRPISWQAKRSRYQGKGGGGGGGSSSCGSPSPPPSSVGKSLAVAGVEAETRRRCCAGDADDDTATEDPEAAGGGALQLLAGRGRGRPAAACGWWLILVGSDCCPPHSQATKVCEERQPGRRERDWEGGGAHCRKQQPMGEGEIFKTQRLPHIRDSSSFLALFVWSFVASRRWRKCVRSFRSGHSD
jgi:hypothetical protein